MIFGGGPGGASLGQRPRVVVVGDREIRFARKLLLNLARNLKGTRLSPWQRRRVSALATAVALRRKRRLSPTLSREQAMEIYQTVTV